MTALFAATLFLSASLLFIAEPMMGKLILPVLGGTPAVWNTCVMFFQFELLVGYLYAHLSATRLGLRAQAALHLGLLTVGLVALPLALRGDGSAGSQHPIATVLLLLARSVGLPLLAIAASAPLLQRWLSTSRDPSARDPFFLYAASNLGSLLALVSYPFLIEPALRLTTQRWAWSAGYILLLALTAVCAWRAQRAVPLKDGDRDLTPAVSEPLSDQAHEVVSLGRRARWLALAFVPSSLMLSVTTYISTDIAAVPLLWVIPLALYLLTYVLAFARRQFVSVVWMNRLLPVAIVVASYFFIIGPRGVLWRVLAVPLVTLFIAGVVCHGQLAADRPSPRKLTEYYLWLSIGGLLGGVFNTLVAPLLFTRTLEYPLGLVLAALLRPPRSRPISGWGWRRIVSVAAPALVGALALTMGAPFMQSVSSMEYAGIGVRLAAPLLVSLLLAATPIRFGVAVGLVAAVGLLPTPGVPRLLEVRTFFGTHRVLDDGGLRLLGHGTTTHGAQALQPDRRCEPLSYYTRSGPIGQVFRSFYGYASKFHVASIGLGAGALAAYSQTHQDWTFFEINPEVVRIARDPRYFTYLQDCAQNFQIVLGDARLEIARQQDQRFDVMVFDAFSSDAIPIHLATREALALYLRKLAPRGILAFHISNRFLDLGPVLGDLARDAGLVGLIEHDSVIAPEERARGKFGSDWVILARAAEDFGDLRRDLRWTEAPTSGRPLWTDDYSNIVSTFRRAPPAPK